MIWEVVSVPIQYATHYAARHIHIAPVGDDREHELTRDCWCQPTLDDESPEASLVYIHNALDRREEFEGTPRARQ